MVWRLISLGWWLFTGGVEKITTDSVWFDMYMVKFRGGLYWPSGNGGGHPAGDISVWGRLHGKKGVVGMETRLALNWPRGYLDI